MYETFEMLSGAKLNLDKLQTKDFNELAANLMSPTTWASAVRGINSDEKMKDYLEAFVRKQELQQSLTLVARLRSNQEIVAMSTFHGAPENFSRVEIGYTWVSDKWMRTFVNTEMKYLMLKYAFESFKVKRVEFSVDPRNSKSNTAVQRIGAKLEGTLRKWRFLNESDKGDRNIYSIIDDEWPGIKTRLKNLLRP